MLVVLVLGGGGWYFATRIGSDGLAVKPYPTTYELVLTRVHGGPGHGSVTIRSSSATELARIKVPSTYGLSWRGGYAQVSGPVVQQTRDEVVRRFHLVSGHLPVEGTHADLDLAAFPAVPALALGPTVRVVRYTSPLGRFPAWLLPGSGPGGRGSAHTWAVVVHGKGGSRTEMARMTRATAAAGLPSLDITYRNDPGLPDDPSRHYQYGRTEWQDLRGAVAYAAAHGATRVVLGADSMGGGIVASYLRHRAATDSPAVVGLVLDAPMLDFGRTVSYGAEQLKIPLVGHVPSFLTWTAKRIAGMRYGIDWSAVDYLDDSRWLTVPTLLFHGTADKTVPFETSRELALAKPRLVTFVPVSGVDHVRSWNADPQAYAARIAHFLAPLTR